MNEIYNIFNCSKCQSIAILPLTKIMNLNPNLNQLLLLAKNVNINWIVLMPILMEHIELNDKYCTDLTHLVEEYNVQLLVYDVRN